MHLVEVHAIVFTTNLTCTSTHRIAPLLYCCHLFRLEGGHGHTFDPVVEVPAVTTPSAVSSNTKFVQQCTCVLQRYLLQDLLVHGSCQNKVPSLARSEKGLHQKIA
jgi:hypothetical protein